MTEKQMLRPFMDGKIWKEKKNQCNINKNRQLSEVKSAH